MIISLQDVGKQYQKHFILRHFTATFSQENTYGIKGENGSGKSTLLQLISSVLTPTEGSITYTIKGKELTKQEARLELLIVSPTLDLIGDLSLKQTLEFHYTFKAFDQINSIEDFLEQTWLTASPNTLVKDLSSGMRQRLKLGLAFFSKNQFILLDEPTSNLDQKGINWVNALLKQQKRRKGIIIASNEERDFLQCDQIYDVMDYKTA